MEPERSEASRMEATPNQLLAIDQNETSFESALTHPRTTSESMDSQESWNEDRHTQVQFHSYMAPYVLKALLDGGISLVEYGSQLRFRCGYAEVLTVKSTEAT